MTSSIVKYYCILKLDMTFLGCSNSHLEIRPKRWVVRLDMRSLTYRISDLSVISEIAREMQTIETLCPPQSCSKLQ